MNTSILTLALASAIAAPTWETSYHSAQETAAAQKKPLAIFFGPGSSGWTKVTRDTAPPLEVSKVLADKYVCVHIDTTSTEGKKFAESVGISGGHGVVLGNRAGTLQAFWHQGDLSSQSLSHYLQKYADPQVVVTTTETVNSVRTSNYPAPAMRTANC